MISSKANDVIELLVGMKVSTCFKVVYLLLACFSFNNIIADTALVAYGTYFVVASGFVILAARFARYSRFATMPFLGILALFLISYAASSFLSAKYGIAGNIKAFVWMTLQFFVLYVTDKKSSPSDRKNELLVVSLVFIAYVFIAGAISVAMAFVGYGYEPGGSGSGYNSGMAYGRLWGVYIDPNHGAVMSLLSIVLSIWIFVSFRLPRKVDIALKIFFALNCLVQLLYVGYSASRTAWLAVAVVGAMLAFGFACEKVEGGAKKKIATALGSAVFTAILSFALILLASSSYASVVEPMRAYFAGSTVDVSVEHEEAQEESATSEVVVPVEEGPSSGLTAAEKYGDTEGESDSSPAESMASRNSEGDASAGRTTIWKEAMNIVKDHPLFGISHRNILPYVEEMYPTSRIAYWDHAWMHCIFIDVLVSQGIVGLALFLSLVGAVFVRAYKILSACAKEDFFSTLLVFSSLFAIAISALFHTEILFVNTVATVMFWILLGYFVSSKRGGGDESA